MCPSLVGIIKEIFRLAKAKRSKNSNKDFIFLDSWQSHDNQSNGGSALRRFYAKQAK